MINQEKLKARRKRNYLNKREDRLAYRKEYYKKNKEHIIKKSCDWAKNNPERRKHNLLKSMYNLSIEDYNQMFEEQEGCCKVCGKYQSEVKKGLCVDHDHITSKVRGLLCQYCNSALGYANDDTEVLHNLIKYLQDAELVSLVENQAKN